MLFIRNYCYPFNTPETISMGASYVSLAQFKSFRHFKPQHDTYSFNSKVEKMETWNQVIADIYLWGSPRGFREQGNMAIYFYRTRDILKR